MVGTYHLYENKMLIPLKLVNGFVDLIRKTTFYLRIVSDFVDEIRSSKHPTQRPITIIVL